MNPGAGETLQVKRPTRRRWPKRVLWILAVPVSVVVVIVVAWLVDSALSGDTVARNTELAGVAVGGMDADQLGSATEDLAAQLPDTAVNIDAGDLQLTSTAGDLGVEIDVDATTSQVLDASSTKPLWQQPFEWVGSFFTPRSAPVELTVDQATMGPAIEGLEGDERKAPTEPSIVVADGQATLSPGVDGIELDSAEVAAALPESLDDVGTPIEVTVDRTVVPPKFSDDEATPLVAQANEMAQRSTKVVAGQQTFELEGSAIIDGVVLDTSGEAPKLTVSDTVIGQAVVAQQTSFTNPTGVTFTQGNGGLVPVAGHDAEICCGEGAVGAIVDALIAGSPEVQVPTRTMTAAEGVEWASTLGVNQVVSEFTTNHPCCQGRVNNIHTIADRVRGTLIAPGGTFSVNDLTGRRTTEKGYVPAPAIVDGKHVPDVGGGVSQFATTTFNAAFFAGLPIPQYKMHSEYISRYPYGREATLFYDTVDLKIHNDTPYGIVIWPTYTGTSITVQLWSTPYAHGEMTNQSQTSGCGSVTTQRTITYPDGSTKKDDFRANYRCG